MQLTVLAQLILSNDSVVVDMVADLLYTLVEHNLAVNRYDCTFFPVYNSTIISRDAPVIYYD